MTENILHYAIKKSFVHLLVNESLLLMNAIWRDTYELHTDLNSDIRIEVQSRLRDITKDVLSDNLISRFDELTQNIHKICNKTVFLDQIFLDVRRCLAQYSVLSNPDISQTEESEIMYHLKMKCLYDHLTNCINLAIDTHIHQNWSMPLHKERRVVTPKVTTITPKVTTSTKKKKNITKKVSTSLDNIL